MQKFNCFSGCIVAPFRWNHIPSTFISSVLARKTGYHFTIAFWLGHPLQINFWVPTNRLISHLTVSISDNNGNTIPHSWIDFHNQLIAVQSCDYDTILPALNLTFLVMEIWFVNLTSEYRVCVVSIFRKNVNENKVFVGRRV